MIEFVDYKVVNNTNISDLCREVKVYISNGWEPQGGVSSTWLDRVEYFYQAVVKKRVRLDSEEIGF